MAIAVQEMMIKKPIQKVWKTVTDLKHYAWRSDIKEIEIVNDTTFVEVSKENIATRFTITAFEKYKRYEFDIENSNMKGHWIGLFEETREGVKFTCEEHVEAKKVIMKPFIKKYLSLQQNQYQIDLCNELEK